VDFAYASHEDGSASITVGNVDRVYGMEWTVELILRPGSTVLEQRVRVSNRSDVRHRFYWWSNAGVQIWDDSRIEYPMRFAASHGFTEVQPWPVDAAGKDLSIIKNPDRWPVSVFVHGSRENFMGIWHPTQMLEPYISPSTRNCPPKKIWSWGVDADGLDWRKALSDNDSAYAEVQGACFATRRTYASSNRASTSTSPNIGCRCAARAESSRANLSGVVHLSREKDALTVALNVNQSIRNAVIQLRGAANLAFNENADLSPKTTWTKKIPLRTPITNIYSN